MLEDYVVNVRLPVNESEAVLGTSLGYTTPEGGTPLYWDGQDVWLPPSSATLLAALRGTLSFIPSESAIFEWEPAVTERLGTPLPALGDTLLLQIWPSDYVKLRELLPEGSPVPKYVVYQNVDRDAAVRRAEALIVDNPEHIEHYRKIFATEADADPISNEVLRERARAWIRDEWLQHRGVGILVAAGDDIGEAARVPTVSSESLPSDVQVDHAVPAGADAATWRRLTLKVATETFLYDPAFWHYLVASVENTEWTTRPMADSEGLVGQWVRAVRERRALKVTHQLNPDWSHEQPPEPEMPPASPDLVVHLKRTTERQPTIALFDPFTLPAELWRAQGQTEEGVEYEWGFEGGLHYVQFDVPDIFLWDPAFPYPDVGVRTNAWFPFDGQHRFILGLNMATCRKANGHDLAANFFLPASWGVWIEGAGNLAKLDNDFANIAAAGFTCVRMWAFESMEGLDFGFEAEYAAAIAQADTLDPMHPLKRVLYNGEQFYACTHAEFVQLTVGWNLRVVSGPRIAQLIRNAEEVQRRAQRHGLRVLWTLWTHYGEAMLGLDGNFWNDFMQIAALAPLPTTNGRMPLDAWLYRELMVDPSFLSSYAMHAVQPLVRALERVGPRNVLGYEVMNEANLHWDNSGLGHVIALSGIPDPADIGRRIYINGTATGRNFRSMSTGWPLTREQIHAFVNLNLTAISTEAPEKITLSGVTNGDLSLHQTTLFWDPVDPIWRVTLSATAFTRYASLTGANSWRTTYTLATHPWLSRHNGRCLFVEAGEDFTRAGGYDCDRNAAYVREILRKCYRRGYAGVFLWEYADPERGAAGNNFRDQNAFTEYEPSPGAPHNHTSTVSFVGASPRVSADVVHAFSTSQGRLIVPLLIP
jgi:hypothetical protein